MIRALCIFSAALLCACAGQVTEPNYYLLRPAAQTGSQALTPSDSFAMGPVVIAPYIDQAGLLLETQENQVRPARQHLWAEPVQSGISTYLQQAVSRDIGYELMPPHYAPENAAIAVRIDQFHGTRNGQAKLVAYWWLSRAGEVASAHRFAHTQTLDADGYPALARAQKALLDQLAAEIAGNLKSATE